MHNYQPVFIIGAGRSGTKFLRDTLGISEMCARIPYDVGYVWRYGNEDLLHDEIDAASLSSSQVEWIRKNLLKLADKDVPKPKAKYILEKSVPNSLRPALLYRCFPEGKFVQLIRDGRAVTESAMRMWQMPPEKKYLLDKVRYFPWSNYKYGLWFLKNQLFNKDLNRFPIWGPRYKGIQDDLLSMPLHMVCAKQWSMCVIRSYEQLLTIPPAQVLTVSYDELMGNSSAIDIICNFIGIDSRPVIDAWAHTVQQGNDDKWRTGLTGLQINDIEQLFTRLPVELSAYVRDN